MDKKINKADVDDILTVRPTQLGILYHHLEEEGRALYNVQLSLDIKGALDLGLLQKAWDSISGQHPALRSVFRWNLSKPLQIILKEYRLGIGYTDISDTTDPIDIVWGKLAEEDRYKRFDLTELPIRIMVFKMDEYSFRLMITHHHILYDGWSTSLLLKGLFQAYGQLADGTVPSHSNNSLSVGVLKKLHKKTTGNIEFWKSYLEDFESKNLISDRHPEQGLNSQADKVCFTTLGQPLSTFVKTHKVTPASVVYAAYSLLLSKYLNTAQVVFGTTVSGRDPLIQGIDHVIGNFVNTLPFKVDISGEKSLLAHVIDTYQKHQTVQGQGDISYYEIRKGLQMDPSSKLFDSIVVVENYPVDDAYFQDLKGIDIALHAVHEHTEVPLVIAVYLKEQIQIELIYKASQIDTPLVSSIGNQFLSILGGIIENPDRKISSLNLLSESEANFLQQFNQTAGEYPYETVLSSFKGQVNRSPGSIACICGGQAMTYSQLDTQSSQIASYLQNKQGIGKGSLVAIYQERSFELVATILGILKSGAAYVGLDPSNPTDRVTSIIENSGVSLVLTSESTLEIEVDVEQVNVKQVLSEENIPEDTDWDKEIRGEDLAYVLYTSGSTGKPKGVMITHQSLSNYIHWAAGYYVGEEELRFGLYTSISFDLTVTSVFTPLVTGNAMVVYRGSGHDLIEEVLEDNQVELLKLTPSHLRLVRDSPLDLSASVLRKLIVGGEEFDSSLAKSITEKFSGQVGLYNEYGPTEATVGCMVHEYSASDGRLPSVPLGGPIANMGIYVLDRYGHPVGAGCVGEVYISGVGLSKGYLGDEGKTSASFIVHEGLGLRLYRTGDLAKWDAGSGSLLFVGREDSQVKVRGYRIELGEIEGFVSGHGEVDHGVVLLSGEGADVYLSCYYVSERGLTGDGLREYLLTKVPEYMVPQRYVRVEEMPLTAHGKVDKTALAGMSEEGSQYQAPANEIEELLSKIWGEVLNHEQVGVSDHFFQLGGDSIKSIQVSSKLRNAGYQVGVRDIIESKTIKNLAPKLIPLTSETDQSPITGNIPITPIQYRFLNGDLKKKAHYNQSVMLGFKNGLTLAQATLALKKIQTHHDALRVTFKLGKEGWVQENHGIEYPVSVVEYNLSAAGKDADKAFKKWCDEIQGKIDLTNGPLMHWGLFHEGDHTKLLIVAHHLVIDGVSMRVLLEDIAVLYHQMTNGKPMELPLKTDAYKLYAESLHQYIHSDKYSKAKKYWSGIDLSINTLVKPDHQNQQASIKNLQVGSFTLDQDTTRQLLGEIHSAFHTRINDILLSSLALSIKHQFGIDQVLIDMEGHGREDLDGVNIDRTIGWFTSIYPLVIDAGGDDLSTMIKRTKENLRNVPNNGVDYLLMCQHDKVQASRSQICFNYLGQFDRSGSFDAFETLDNYRGKEISEEEVWPYDLDFLGFVTDGKLHIDLRYSSDQFDPETVTTITDKFRSNLLSIINYCLAQEKNQLTPSDLTYKSLSIELLDSYQDKFGIEDIYTLSPMQEGMLFHYLLDPGSNAYFEQKVLTLNGIVDVNSLELSFRDLVSSHDVFRTIFRHKNLKKPIQMVLSDPEVDFHYEDLYAKMKKDGIDTYVRNFKENDRAKKFDPVNGPLLRMALLKTGHDEFKLIWSNHHLLMDGWCLGLLWRELMGHYRKHQNREEVILPNEVKYSQYISWLESKNQESTRDFWQEYTQGFNTVTTLPTTGNTKDHASGSIAHTIKLDQDQSEKLKNISKAYEVTPFALIQCAWAILLGKYNCTNDVLFGTVVSGRPVEIPEVENMIGLFVNTVPMRVQFTKDMTIAALLTGIQQQSLDREGHEYLSLAEIQTTSELGKNLFDHIVVYENYPLSEEIKRTDHNDNDKDDEVEFKVSDIEVFEQTNYDFMLVINPGLNFEIKLQFLADKYHDSLMKSVLSQLEMILTQLVSSTVETVGEITILSEAEKGQIMTSLDRSDVLYPTDKTVLDIFLQQVRKSPDKVAIKYGEKEITYRALHDRVSLLTQCLISKGVRKGQIVGLLMDRSIETVVGMLGILGAGGAYLPIDVDYPSERIGYMASNSKCEFLVTSAAFKDKVPDGVVPIYFEDIKATATPSELQCIAEPSDLCYIIYTSGTTGNPKGVMVTHQNVVRLFFNEDFQFAFGPEDVWTMFHSHCFDFSVWEIYGALLFGGKLIIVPKSTSIDTKLFLKLLKTEGATVLNQTPSAFYNLIQQELTGPGSSLKLRYVIFGGEALNPGKLRKWYGKYPKTRLINMFGITETTVHVTYKEIGAYEITDNVSNIGKPIPTLSAYIVDETGELLPQGAVGELYVGGAGVSNGYLGMEQLTNERFRKNPWGSGKVYKTGDLARLLPSGDIEYIGRIDAQIQLRGFRIELGEIENALMSYPDIREAVVGVSGKQEEKLIVAYYVSDGPIKPSLIKAHIARRLPEYMLPSYYMPIDVLPLTSNGKLDRKALPEFEFKNEDAVVVPKNEIQVKLVKVWSGLLEIPESGISINANFFDIGGNSLKVVRMVDLVNEEFDASLTVADAFTHTTIAMLADFIALHDESNDSDTSSEDVDQMKDVLSTIWDS